MDYNVFLQIVLDQTKLRDNLSSETSNKFQSFMLSVLKQGSNSLHQKEKPSSIGPKYNT